MGLFLPLQTNFPNHFVGRKSLYFEGFDYSALMMDPLSRKIQKMQNLLALKFYFPNPYRRSSFFLTDTRAQVSSCFLKKWERNLGLTIARASILTHSSTAAVWGSFVVIAIVVIFCLVLFLLLSFWNAEKNGKYNNSFESHISLMYTHKRLLSSVESVIRGGSLCGRRSKGRGKGITARA